MLAVSLEHSRHSEEMCGIDEFYLPFVSLMQLLTQAWRNKLTSIARIVMAKFISRFSSFMGWQCVCVGGEGFGKAGRESMFLTPCQL